jgi:hypothetical protein
MKKVTLLLWFTAIIGLFLYSFTQIDLNLIISRFAPIYTLEQIFQSIGYFNRPLSTILYLILLILLFIGYWFFWILARRRMLSEKEFWLIIIFSCLILLFSYPAFSYDIYNYMFDAKTIVFYHQNPWIVRPLYFSTDPWLNFMHWTHRPTVYPPFWILLTLPLYFFSFNIFIIALLYFKSLMALGYIVSIYVMKKLLMKTQGNKYLPQLVFYAFNPLLLIEFLVSGHNDIIMMFFALISLLMLIKNRKMSSFIVLILSILIKYMTFVLIPIFVARSFINRKLSDKRVFQLSFLCLVVGLAVSIVKMEIQPWYYIWVFPFMILSGWNFFWPISVGLAFGLLLRYLPFLFFGNWDNPIPLYKTWLTLVPFLISIGISFIVVINRRKNKHA